MYISTSFMQDTVNRLSFRLQKQFYCVTRISFNAQRKKKSIITFDIKKGPAETGVPPNCPLKL